MLSNDLCIKSNTPTHTRGYLEGRQLVVQGRAEGKERESAVGVGDYPAGNCTVTGVLLVTARLAVVRVSRSEERGNESSRGGCDGDGSLQFPCSGGGGLSGDVGSGPYNDEGGSDLPQWCCMQPRLWRRVNAAPFNYDGDSGTGR
ncbi:PREDICTED: uncharacterized protein LOC108371361 [Rhagoletis zephyria]|uniref:uncharacterized protein LOC108371361 n=1 Tax=Rhagoletis zephyria TaxID=28612 RepID=UPI000811AA30|nr:PREDICTED: uncharacterized protein LOC108371361 [Rhagoletis zephyria]